MAPYARTEVLLTLLIGGVLTALAGYGFGWWALVPALPTLFLLSFYRDPPRRIPSGDRLLLSPADGRIMSVERGYRGPEGGGPELRICIFLSVFNVHVNRSPCAGRVAEVIYREGLFLNALKPEATLRNENSLLVIEPDAPIPGPVRVRQIAGLLAKRIVCAAKPGDVLAAGQRFGMIKLGSQTEIRVPDQEGWGVRVKAGDVVHGGTTVLAELQE
ncbi:MAG: phosphatidylserine decarboxylase family protein [Planctomycetes bacterium]|nr:phosphatidylserine decarboxylase family protein [Planctomycetota bacterium]